MTMMDRLGIPQAKQDDSNDVTLMLKDRKELRVNRSALSEASPFFFALLNSDMRENKEGIIRLEHMTDIIMRDVLEFTHSGTVEITSTNAQELIEAADFLLLPNLKTIAGRFLKDNITTSNCVSIYYFADKYQCEELVIRKAKEFILSNFEVVAKSEDFLNLDAQQVEEWISSDAIAISSENEVIKIILTWIERSKSERKGKLEELFRHVRLAFVTRDYLKKDVVTNHLVKENSSCLKLLRGAMKGICWKTAKNIPQSPVEIGSILT
ncbi:kelch-like protein 2 [Oculina patagonica]